MFTVIVTGSRNWKDWEAVWKELHSLYEEHRELLVIHGGCPTGADHYAEEWVRNWYYPLKVGQRVFSADWTLHGRAAGPIRNREMAQAGADLCLAFPLGKSYGTWNCVNECKKAGIPVKVIE
ncbi:MULTISPECIES: DUF2493 domain-containing protein [unclassified Streptomyces]|uniref:DUF2493 domain-containing protein n=1 Tax=unclassified Streptomyces TaxID=2593676 RepID=UPI00099F3EC6|nr:MULTISPECIES: DUF2493 domain-containing protein [unclassified Streptomyces]